MLQTISLVLGILASVVAIATGLMKWNTPDVIDGTKRFLMFVMSACIFVAVGSFITYACFNSLSIQLPAWSDSPKKTLGEMHLDTQIRGAKKALPKTAKTIHEHKADYHYQLKAGISKVEFEQFVSDLNLTNLNTGDQSTFDGLTGTQDWWDVSSSSTGVFVSPGNAELAKYEAGYLYYVAKGIPD